jgi:hypothetical protein
MEYVLVELPLKNAGGKIRTLPCVLRTLEKNKALPRYARSTSNVSHNVLCISCSAAYAMHVNCAHPRRELSM